VSSTGSRQVGAVLAIGLTFAAWLALEGVVILAAHLRSWTTHVAYPQTLAQVAADPINLGLAQAAGFGLVLMLGLYLAKGTGPVREDLALVSVPMPAALLLLLAGVALQFPLSELGNLLSEIWPTPLSEQFARRDLLSPHGLLGGAGLVFALVQVAPVTEELLFRGLILRGLSARHGPLAGLVLSALLFGALHHGTAMFPAILAGLVLGLVVLRTGSTLASVIVHAAVNAVPVLLPEQVYPLRGFNVVSEHVYHLPPAWVVSTTLVAFGAFYLLFRMSDSEDV